MLNKIFKKVVGILSLPLWIMQYFIPRDKSMLLFSSWFGNKYSDNSKIMYEYLLKNEKTYKPIWITRNKSVYENLKKRNMPVAKLNSIKGIYYCLRAGSLFMCQGCVDFNIFLTNKSKRIWLWHGSPLKKIKGSVQSKVACLKLRLFIYRFIFPYLIDSQKVDCVLAQSEVFVPIFQEAFKVNKEKIIISGNPRNDVFTSTERDKLISSIKNKFSDAKIILYMPTFRRLRNGKRFEPFCKYNFNHEKLISLLNTENYIFLNKRHYVEENEYINYDSDRFINVNEKNCDDIYFLLKDIDLLITDYSSVYFDYILLRKPVVLTPFNLNEYASEDRGFYFDYESEIEGIKAYNWDQVIEILKNKKYYSASEANILKYNKYTQPPFTENAWNCIKKFL